MESRKEHLTVELGATTEWTKQREREGGPYSSHGFFLGELGE